MWPNRASGRNIAIDFIMLVGSLDTLGIIVFVLILNASIFSVKQWRILITRISFTLIFWLQWRSCCVLKLFRCRLIISDHLNISVTIKFRWWWWWCCRRPGSAVMGVQLKQGVAEHTTRGARMQKRCDYQSNPINPNWVLSFPIRITGEIVSNAEQKSTNSTLM